MGQVFASLMGIGQGKDAINNSEKFWEPHNGIMDGRGVNMVVD